MLKNSGGVAPFPDLFSNVTFSRADSGLRLTVLSGLQFSEAYSSLRLIVL